MNEHALIARYFIPLAKPFAGSLALQDDAALLDVPAGQQLVVTQDAMSEGIHFIGNEDPALIARKLLRTNLSDLAAMGATPWCYFLSLALPSPLCEETLARFAEGLAEDQPHYSIYLAGGDTITTNGAPTFSITAHGLVPQGLALRRNGAKVGDCIYVSGTLGDAALGLQSLRQSKDEAFLIERYQLPQPRLAIGQLLRGLATSCIDISDGLLKDMAHICDASQVGAALHLERLPLSAAARRWVSQDSSAWPFIYGGGDDYELLFTLPKTVTLPPSIAATAIGEITSRSGGALYHHGEKITPERTGYSH